MSNCIVCGIETKNTYCNSNACRSKGSRLGMTLEKQKSSLLRAQLMVDKSYFARFIIAKKEGRITKPLAEFFDSETFNEVSN